MNKLSPYQARAYTDALSAGEYDMADAEKVAKELLAAGYAVPADAQGSTIDAVTHQLTRQLISTAGQQPACAALPLPPEDDDE